MHIILVPVGTSGDVYPFVAIGLRLKELGHRITVVASGTYRDLLDTVGLPMLETIDVEREAEVFDQPEFWRPVRGMRRISSGIIVPSLVPQLAAIEGTFERGGTVIVGSTLAFGARVAAEKLGAPMVTVHLAPAAIRSLIATPAVPHMPGFPRLPRIGKRLLYWYADRHLLDQAMTHDLNRVRAGAGLPPVDRPMQGWIHSPSRVIGLFPAWFAPPAADWPAQTRLTGFVFYDGARGRTMPDDLEAFLAAGPAPIVFTAGTAMLHGADFFRAAVEACTELGMRGILVDSSGRQLEANLPERMLACAYAPFGDLLPRARAIVHHGGIGTSARALKAGIAQVVVPMAYDQTDNAARLERLRVATALRPRRVNGTRLARAVDKLLARAELDASLRSTASRFAQDTALDETCELILAAGIVDDAHGRTGERSPAWVGRA